jgi:DNA-binding response OmpR family regulator
VLVIEDDREMRELVCDVLEEAGFATQELEDGTRAVDLAAARRPAFDANTFFVLYDAWLDK